MAWGVWTWQQLRSPWILEKEVTLEGIDFHLIEAFGTYVATRRFFQAKRGYGVVLFHGSRYLSKYLW